MVLRVIAELKVKCNHCLCELTYEDHRNHLCRAIGGQTDIAVPCTSSTAADPSSVSLGQAIEQLRWGEITPEMEQIGTVFLKSKMKSSADGKKAMLKTGGKVSLNYCFLNNTSVQIIVLILTLAIIFKSL